MRTGRGGSIAVCLLDNRPFDGAVKMCRSIEPGHLPVFEGMAISIFGLGGKGHERYLSRKDTRAERARKRVALLIREARDGGGDVDGMLNLLFLNELGQYVLIY